MMAWLWAKVSKYAAIAGAIIVAIGTALTFGFLEGKKTGAAKGEADAAQAKAAAAEHDAAVAASDQKAEQAAQQTASEVRNEMQKLPDAPAQQIGTADPHSAAGELRDWTRDQNDPQ